MKKDENKEKLVYLKKVSESLESMILGSDITSLQETMKSDLPSIHTIKPLNYELIKSSTNTKAEEIVESVVLLYLPKEFIFEHDYVNQKMSVDKLTISDLLFQMTTAEHGIKLLLEDIDTGNRAARSFEVLGSLQKSKMEIVKHLAQFMVMMENNYKNLRADYESTGSEKTHVKDIEAEEIREETTTRFRGTKGLMASLQGHIQEALKNKNGGYEDVSNE